MTLFYLSHIINILILIPVCLGLLKNVPQNIAVFGEDTTARQILTCMYLTIIVISSYALTNAEELVRIGLVLFVFQIIYKVFSIVLIKDKRVPVYWFNLFVAVFHSVTLGVYYFN